MNVPADAWAKTSFQGEFRSNQLLALEAFESGRISGRSHCYLVMPPGSGKTVLGLEIARRLGRPTLCLGPNTAIQEQWITQWQRFQPASVSASDSSELSTPLTALTYQAICNLDSASLPDDSMAGDVNDAERRRAAHRATIDMIRAGDRAQLLGLLRPHGRRIVETLKSSGTGWTLVLDECHHLLEMWGHLLAAIVGEIGSNAFLVGLTATPPYQLYPREAELYRSLFGAADFEIPTPAVVKEGHLAPYQELAYITQPLPHEVAFINEDSVRFAELISAVCDPQLGSIGFLEWVRRRLVERTTSSGPPVSWAEIEAHEPDLARAGMRLFLRDGIPLPNGARVHEQYRQKMTADDWVVLLGDWCAHHLAHSDDAADQRAWELVHRGLASAGYQLTTTGIRVGVAPVDRVLLLSGAKAVAAIEILTSEWSAIGAALRALVLCDYELAGADVLARLRGVLDPNAGSAALTLKTLLSDDTVRGLDPLLVTGKTVACSRETALRLIPWLEARGVTTPITSTQLVATNEPDIAWQDVVALGGAWSPRVYVPLVTAAFEKGVIRCLIGTRGMLGEGWDAPSVNVLIDMTGATTLMSVSQMRGRSLRLDPNNPRKVADNWDIVCVDSAHPKGAADYARFVRKHESYYGINSAGEIESGVSHSDPRLTPFSPPDDAEFAAVNFAALERVGQRDKVYDAWGVGTRYHNVEMTSLRVLVRRGSPGAIALTKAHTALPTVAKTVRARQIATGVSAIAISAALVVGLGTGGALLAVLIVAAAAGALATGLAPGWTTPQGDGDVVGAIGSAVAEALKTNGTISPGAEAVDLDVQQDGYYRCVLRNANHDESTAFANALDECVGPLTSPRYIIARVIHSGATTMRARVWATFQRPAVVYHAVPSAFGNAAKAATFARAWSEYVNAASPTRTSTPEGAAILAIQRGEDVFSEMTQMRSLWD